MNYHNITHEDMNNGDGLRVVLWVSGCEHHCPECQNPQTWGYESGVHFDESALGEIFLELNKDYISGITFSGGDPLALGNCAKVANLCYHIKKYFPNKTIWVYTGYTWEELLARNNFYVNDILRNTDVLVDGEYKKNLRDLKLKWRGSSNQRVIDVQESLRTGKVVLHCD